LETQTIPADIKLFYVEADSFPEGIKPAFAKLEKLMPASPGRQCFGIYQETPDGISYKAAALETEDGEGARLGCSYFTIEKGEYLAETIIDWQSRIESIGPTFEAMLKDDLALKNTPCIEYYKSMQELVCLVKMAGTGK
jgi:hypothetical protein